MRWGEMIHPWWSAGLSLVYPEVCQLCSAERAGPGEGYVCARCRSQVEFIQPPFCQCCGLPFEGDLTAPFSCTNCRDLDLHFRLARSAVVAKTTALQVIYRYKYSKSLWFEPFLADLLLTAAVPELSAKDWDWIVPVPLHPRKQWEREFNQAERLAKHLSRATGIPLNTKLLRRSRATVTQTKLTRVERAVNMKQAFELVAGARVAGQRVVVVDDVFTTGATTSACAAALRGAGAVDVCVWTVARGI